jgi:multiple sugar transport system permease protein
LTLHHKKLALKNLPFYLLATFLTLAFTLPLVWMVSASLRTPGLPPPRSVEWLPQPIAWRNYSELFQLLPIGCYLVNSFLVASMGAALTLIIASLAGFGMAQLGSQTRRRLLALSVGLLLIPFTNLWLARFLIYTWFGWIDSYLSLLAPALMGTTPFFVLLFYWSFRRQEQESFEAARLEGAKPMQIWLRIALPQSRSTTAAVIVLAFIYYWNDFINPLLYLKSQRLYTLAIGLQQLFQLDRTNWPLLLAGSVIMTLPVVVLFFVAQRHFLNELEQKR